MTPEAIAFLLPVGCAVVVLVCIVIAFFAEKIIGLLNRRGY